jgi:hypothetical protein
MTGSVVWLVPAAFAGLALLAVPVLIHLFTQRDERRVLFPSLRFLSETSVAASRRRLIGEWPLLVLRALAIAAAVSALAGPLIVTAAREVRWAGRVSKALVQLPGAASLADERRGAYATADFHVRGSVVDSVRLALRWLDDRPASSRELVIAGDLPASLDLEAALSQVPPHVGVRFLPATDSARTRDAIVPVLERGPAGARVTGVPVRLEDDRTVVTALGNADAGKAFGSMTSLYAPLEVRAAPADQEVADAALRAVVSGGLPLDQSVTRRLVVTWEGGSVADLGAPVRPPTARAGSRQRSSGWRFRPISTQTPWWFAYRAEPRTSGRP